MDNKKLIELLDGVRNEIDKVPCNFWACDGEDEKPKYLKTCNTCMARIMIDNIIRRIT